MNHIIGLSKVTAKGQCTVPRDVMTELELEPNDKIVWVREDGRIEVRKA